MEDTTKRIDPRQFDPDSRKIESWRCYTCGTLLGRISKSTGILVIKYKDMYLEIHPCSTISVLCRKCGIRVERTL